MTCVICTENLEGENVHTLPECNHQFHTQCIISWFQQGTHTKVCPLCRSESGATLCIRDVNLRSSMMRQIALRRGAPKALVRLSVRLRKIENLYKERKRTLRQFKLEHREIFKTYFKMCSSVGQTFTRQRNARRLLGLFASPECPIPLLLRRTLRIQD